MDSAGSPTVPSSAGPYASASRWVNRALRIIDAALAPLAAPSGTAPIPEPRRILLANLGHLGDAILATAVLPVLRRAFPSCRIGFLIGTWARSILHNHPLVDELHFFDHWRINRLAESRWWKLRRHNATRQQALSQIVRLRYDAAIDLRYYFGNAIPLFWQAGIPVRIGYTGGGFGPLLTHPVEWRRLPCHVIDYHAALLRLLPLDEQHLVGMRSNLPRLPAEEAPTALTTTLPDRSAPYLVLHPGCGSPAREWPIERWRVLARRLADDGRTLVLTGNGPAEQEQCGQIADGLPRAVNLCGRLTWLEYVAVVRGARLLVGVDSMAVHLADAVDTPTLVLSNGIHPPELWRPRLAGSQTLRHAVACAPCHRQQGCAAMDCVRQIEVEQVWHAIQSMLQEVGRLAS